MGVFFIIIIISLLLLLLWMFYEAHQNNLVKYSFEFIDYPRELSPLTLFFISDIHRRNISNTLLNQVKDQAELIIIGGDLVERGVPLTRVYANLKKLTDVAPVFFIWGNHDHEYQEDLLVKVLIDQGVHILQNNHFQIKSKLYLVGVDDSTYNRDDLSKAFPQSDKDSICILLSHNPNIKDKSPFTHKVPLILSGHTHGGQIRLFGWGIRETGGIKHLNNGILVISNGHGTTRYPLRLGAPPDALLITLNHS